LLELEPRDLRPDYQPPDLSCETARPKQLE